MPKTEGIRIEKTGYLDRPTVVNGCKILKQKVNIDSDELRIILWHNNCILLDPDDGYTARGHTLLVDSNNEEYTVVSYHESGDKTYTLTGQDGALVRN